MIEVSIIRVVAMAMVVAYHCLYPLAFGSSAYWPYDLQSLDPVSNICRFLNSIDMPAFVFISGYLYASIKIQKNGYSRKRTFVVKKAKRLLIPLAFWTVVIYLLLPERFVLYKPIDILLGMDHLWFLPMLFGCFVVTDFTYNIWRRLPLYGNLIVILVITVLYYVLFKCQLLAYLPIFFFGVVVVNNNIQNWLSLHMSKSMLAMAGMVLCCVIFLLTDHRLPIHSDLLSRLSGTLFSFISVLFFQRFFKEGCQVNNLILNSLDKNSMGIYLIHQIALFEILKSDWVVGMYRSHVVLTPIIMFLILLLASWALSILINRTKFKFVLG